MIIPSDNYIDNYNQPGVHGLRILVKEEEPVGFTQQP